MGDLIVRIDRERDHPPVGVAAFDGPIDPRRIAAIKAELASDRGSRVGDLILDLEQVRYLHSLGMSALVNLADELSAKGGGLHLAAPQPKVKLVLEMMGLSEWFRIHGSIPAALRAIRSPRNGSLDTRREAAFAGAKSARTPPNPRRSR
jgi:anti-sigma B factor antagonist